MTSDLYSELMSSQLPALMLLANLGWDYLTPSEALVLRDGKDRNVILKGVLEPWLRRQTFERKGKKYTFSDANIQEALRKLDDYPANSLLLNNEKFFELLIGGTSLAETIEGDKRSHTLQYIDWQHPANNVYHVTDEFSVAKRGSHETRRPDVVLFVNGIPLVVMECKRSTLQGSAELRDASVVGEGESAHLSKGIAEAISQQIRNQGMDEIPHLFYYSQLLLAVHKNEAFYATTQTPKKFWSLWKEEDPIEAQVHELINRPLAPTLLDKLVNWRAYAGRIRADLAQQGERLPTAQDRLLYSLLRPQRLLDMIYGFIVFDGGVKKIARYQQYFAIRATLDRVAHLNTQRKRTGGVIWHTTGSGKSLTMVMLAKALSLHPNINNPRVILVTDRVDLDDQIYGTFHACGKSVVQAQNGGHLVRLVTGKLLEKDEYGDVITTVINKFEQAARDHIQDESVDVFVLVDESHRSQYGEMHIKMGRVFPNACYIGFTGTPLTKSEKSTVEKFGDFIHKYPMRQAVADQAVVPLLYEGRIVEQSVDKEQLERWFERTTRHLTEDQKTDLKRKMSRTEVVNATEQRIREIAFNIAMHYEQNWRGTGFKGQLATASKAIGLKYLQFLKDEGIRAELVISPPDTREGHEMVDGLREEPVQAYWRRLMQNHHDEGNFMRNIVDSFAEPDGVEILVVVDKLLTGFDEPRNVVLYVDKPLKQHSLLQAIARVNRLAEGKDFGYIIDYRGVLGELNEAMNLYDALADYDSVDIQGTFTDIAEEIRQLPAHHSDLWSIFQSVANKTDSEAMERYLEPEDRRQQFYETLTDYARALKVALSTVQFYEDTPEKRINLYKQDLQFFHQLRQSVKLRYAEAIDYREYEEKVRKLMDEHIRATGTSIITQMVDIFDAEKFDAEVAKLGNPTAKADTILNRMKRTIAERIDEDPLFYRRFAELIEEVIEAYRQGRMDEWEYLHHSEELIDQMRSGQDSGQPAILNRYVHAAVYYRFLRQALADLSEDELAQIAIGVEEVIETNKVTDWVMNLDVQKGINQALDDYLYTQGIQLPNHELDTLIEQILVAAKSRDHLTR